MKGKLITITILALVLVFTVYKMMQYETSLREEKKVKLYVEDETKPLIDKLNHEELKAIAENSDYYFMADGNYFKKLSKHDTSDTNQKSWDTFFMKGVNMGVAVPGKFPAEFSLSFDEYVEWFRKIGEMNANIIRTYTVLPPEFYDAFAYYNLHHHSKPLYLMQGVWTELPESDNFYDAPFTRSFQKEIISVIDVLHGNAVLKEKPGKAAGVYSTDVSKYVAALLLGREWEPSSVYKTNNINKVHNYIGDFVCLNNGNAMEAWLASMLDFSVLYETQKYHFQHPVSFVNWLPLDPMYHNTEIIENEKVREYDNDLESIDFSRFNSTELYDPGIFAAYHAYPYYPDFIYLQDSYTTSTGNKNVKNSYLYYLQDLKKHNPGMPLVIAEYGLPSSRGNSHFSPFGYHQGGHSEAEQAALSLSLTQDIVEANCAGAIYFEWIDEWFKHNWLVEDFETPNDDRKLWHNMENPEQNFGILAMEERKKTIDGELFDWKDINITGDKIQMLSDADATYFYLALKIPGFDFARNDLYLAFDTYEKAKGDHKLPFTNKIFNNGFEFLAEFKSETNASLLVDEPYSVFTDIYNDHIPVVSSTENRNGKFIHQLLLANRSRTSLLGEKTDSMIYDRSPLLFGKSSNMAKSNADWYFNAVKGILEIRLDWHLLNVCDPAKQYVIDDKAGTPEIEYTKTEAFSIYAFITDKHQQHIIQYPEDEPYTYIWEGWDKPHYSQRLKPVYYTLSEYFKKDLVDENEKANPARASESLNIADFFDNKNGAISISFDEAGYSQYQYAMPVLDKYQLSASFGVVPSLVDNASLTHDRGNTIQVKHLTSKEIKELAINHEIAIQLPDASTINKGDLVSFAQKLNIPVNTLHYQKAKLPASLPGSIIFARESPQKGRLTNNYKGIKHQLISAGVSINSLDSILKTGVHKWSVIVYQHLYDKPSELQLQGSHVKIPENFIQKSDFEKQIRLLRNTDYWIAPERDVYRYLKEKEASRIYTEHFKNMTFLKILSNLDLNMYNHPLTIEYSTNARKVRITGSETDGTYNNRGGSIIFNAMPNKEITIEILD